MKDITVVLNTSPEVLVNMAGEYTPDLCELALYKSLELLTHHVRYEQGLPYVGGRSHAMVSLQSDLDGQAMDDGQPVVEEAKVLVGELASEMTAEQEQEALVVSDPATARVDALAAEAEHLGQEVAEELADLEPGEEPTAQSTSDSSDDESESDNSDEDGDDEDDDGPEEDLQVLNIIEVSDKATELLNALVEGFKAHSTERQLQVLATLDMSQLNGYDTCNYNEQGIVTFKLRK